MKSEQRRSKIKASDAKERRKEARKAERKTERNSVLTSKRRAERKIEEYFSVFLRESGEVADIESLADYLGTTRDEIMAMMSDERVGATLRRARNRIAKIKKQLAFGGKIPASVLSFDLKNNHGYKDKPEEAEAGGEQIIFTGRAAEWAQ